MKKIKYIGFYDRSTNIDENRNYTLSATTKMNYLANTLIQNGYEIEIVSPSWSQNYEGFYGGQKIKLSESFCLTLGPTMGARKLIKKFFRKFLSNFWLIMYVLKNTKKGESIIVYHSLALIRPLKIIKFFKKIIMILEVEELYYDTHYPKSKKKELNFINNADMYVLSTEILREKIEISNKKNVIFYGSYSKNTSINQKKFADGKCHIVYAGIIDGLKKGAFYAVETASHLTSNHHIHILGFGSPTDIDKLNELINSVNKNSACKVTYEGVLDGDQYNDFLSKCHVGLSSQDIHLKYTESSFPSKILTYLGCNLLVIAGYNRCLYESRINKHLLFYYSNNPKEIADLILKIDSSKKIETNSILDELNLSFSNEIKSLLE